MLMKYVYLAGIIDGEGTVTINRHSRNQKGQWHLKPLLRVSDREKKLIDYLVRNFGGSCIKCQQKGHKAVYKWSVHATRDINEILTDVYPYLIVKKQHADVLINFTRSRARAISADHTAPYSDDDMENHVAIKRLNVR